MWLHTYQTLNLILTFVATFKLNHRNDFVDATFVAPKDQRDRLKEIPVHIELVSYISRG